MPRRNLAYLCRKGFRGRRGAEGTEAIALPRLMTPTQCQSDDFQREDSLPVSDVRCTDVLDKRGGSVEGEIQALPGSAKQQGLTRQLGGGARGKGVLEGLFVLLYTRGRAGAVGWEEDNI